MLSRQQELEIIIPKLREDISLLGMQVRGVKRVFDQSWLTQLKDMCDNLTDYCIEHKSIVFGASDE